MSKQITARAWGQQCHKARTLARSLGTRAAAGYLRNRAVPLDTALMILRAGRTK